jgi:hypothetical protein
MKNVVAQNSGKWYLGSGFQHTLIYEVHSVVSTQHCRMLLIGSHTTSLGSLLTSLLTSRVDVDTWMFKQHFT